MTDTIQTSDEDNFFNSIISVELSKKDIMNRIISPHNVEFDLIYQESSPEVTFTIIISTLDCIDFLLRNQIYGSSGQGRSSIKIEKNSLVEFTMTLFIGKDLCKTMFQRINLIVSKREMFQLCRFGKVTSNGYIVNVSVHEMLQLRSKGCIKQLKLSFYWPIQSKRYLQQERNEGVFEVEQDQEEEVLEEVEEEEEEEEKAAEYITKEITLTQADVTYIIGRHGSRIDHFRVASGCRIKILESSTHKDIMLSRQRTPQTITILGPLYKVQEAIKMIQNDLNPRNGLDDTII